MTQIAVGVLVGMLASLFAGIVLIWKGEAFVQFLRTLPVKWRSTLFARAYLLALRTYPYRYANLLALALFGALIISAALAYGLLAIVAWHIDFAMPPEELKETIRSVAKIDTAASIILSPWLLGGFALWLAFLSIRIIFFTIPLEVLVPYAHRELSRLRECIAKCSTTEQYLHYTNGEHTARTDQDLTRLMHQAKAILGDADLKIADEILESVSNDFALTER